MAARRFLILGNIHAVTYRGLWPLIKDGEMWLGPSISGGGREFRVPYDYPLESAGWWIDDDGNKCIHVSGVRWFTNIDHGKRHAPLQLTEVYEE